MPAPTADPGPESLARVLANLLLVPSALVALGVVQWARTAPRSPAPPAPSPTPVAAAAPPLPAPRAVPRAPAPRPAPAAAPTLDREAVAEAESRVEAARRDRARAEARLAGAESALASASARSASRALAARKLPTRLKDPSARIARANARVAALEADRKRLGDELAALDRVPKPRGKPLIDKSPVARPADGEEFHFEVRRDRVAAIDLERLLDQVKVDARIRMRRANGDPPILSGRVGPVGSFSMRYRLARSGDLFDTLGGSYGLQAWEILPESENRGESLDVALRPASDFARAINRLNHERATVTLWVYPDSFVLYRKLRDALHSRGFQVAARPMPDGMPIRGSLTGTVSAGQ